MSFQKIKIFLSLLIIFNTIPPQAAIIHNIDYTTLLNKTYGERAFQLWNIYDEIISANKHQPNLKELESFQSFCRKSNDKALNIESDLVEAVYLIEYHPNQKKQIFKLLNTVIADGKKNHIVQLQARALKTKANYYWSHLQQYELAFEFYQEELSLIQPLKFKDFPDKVLDLYHVGNSYYYFSDYKKAITYFRKTTEYKQGVHKTIDYYITQSYNSLSLSYQKINQLDSSDFYLNKLKVLKTKTSDKQWLGIIDGNLGYNLYLRKNYKAAEPLLKHDVKTALEYSDFGLASGSSMTLANIYLKQKENKKAIDWILKSREYVNKSGQYSRYQRLYPLLSKYYILIGDKQKADNFIDSALFVRDSMVKKFNALQLLRSQQKADIIKHNVDLKAANDKERLRTIQLNLILVFFIIAILIALYIYRLQKKKHALENLLNQQHLSEKEKEIHSAKQELDSFTKSIIEKNRIIASLDKQLKEDSGNTQLLNNLEELRRITIITEQNWEDFRVLFDQVNGGYIHQLKAEFPKITPAEVRFLALKKLNFSYNEMATALGISPQSVRTIAYRMRKKNIITS
ncbi:tetratricopeptide repeat protein [Pedobacter sp. SD-b]|uniref:Tetratricopeptide repeat protein n=1 Tax=Pedobacter segetis TaxID=2793069 RepID=A0ABS1BN80_9SPHI|nr:tetratricopeptide repeat protein [Pedobacter segetis]MBK0384352.1 tetratricopeptide repeat protein [Pedobacter segetis]